MKPSWVYPLAYSRIALGALVLLRTTALSRVFSGIHATVCGPLLGWPVVGAVPVAWAHLRLPDAVVVALCIARTVAAALFAAGLRLRAAGLLVATSGWLVMSQDPFGFTFTVHLLYLSVAVLACTDCSTVLALRPRRARHPESSAALMHLFVASVYFWSAVPKLRGSWLSGAVLRSYHHVGFGLGPLGDQLLDRLARGSAIAAVSLELSLGPLLLWRRTRLAAVIVACSMHAVFEAVLRPDALGWVMIAMLLSFLQVAPGREFLLLSRFQSRKS